MTTLLDTSILIRYLTNDPPHLAEESASIIDSDEALLISPVIIAEAAHVLRSVYAVPREAIVDDLIAVLQKANVGVTGLDTPLAYEALLLCRPSGRVSVADAMLWAEARTANLPVYTFDRRFPDDGIVISRGPD